MYFEFPFPTYGVTIQLTVSSGYVICFASDIYRNPNEAQGYTWRIEVSGFEDIFLDPLLLSYTPGSVVYVAIEGASSSSSSFTLANTEGDRRSTYAHFMLHSACTTNLLYFHSFSSNCLGSKHYIQQYIDNGGTCVLSVSLPS